MLLALVHQLTFTPGGNLLHSNHLQSLFHPQNLARLQVNNVAGGPALVFSRVSGCPYMESGHTLS